MSVQTGGALVSLSRHVSNVPLVLGMLAHAGTSAAQVPERIDDRCGRCQINISRVVTLRDSPSLTGVGSPLSVTRSEGGFYYLVAAELADQVAIFDEAGRINRIVGRSGEGPAEFNFVRSVTAVNSTLFVLDLGNLRIQQFTLPAATFQGQTTVPLRPNYLAVIDSTRFVVNAFLHDAESVGQLYHVVSSGGQLVRSFGYEGEVVRADQQFTRLRPVAARSPDSFWAANVSRYRLEAWDIQGSRIQTLDRHADWFAPHSAAPRFDDSGPPPPHIPAIHQDSLGLLWVLISVADPNWRSAIRSEADAASGKPIERHAYYDTIVEVIDPRNARLLGSHRLDAYVTAFVGSRLIAVGEELPNGEPSVAILQLDLPRANSSTRR